MELPILKSGGYGDGESALSGSAKILALALLASLKIFVHAQCKATPRGIKRREGSQTH